MLNGGTKILWLSPKTKAVHLEYSVIALVLLLVLLSNKNFQWPY